jgi:hypothetical protein
LVATINRGGKKMELDKIIEALTEKEIATEVIDAVKSLNGSDAVEKLTKDLEAERGKAAGIVEDKKKFKTRAEAAEKELKELQGSKLTVEERTQNQIDELNRRLEEADKAKIEQENQFRVKEREAALADIAGSIKWSESIPHDTAKLIISNGFSDIEDLGDKVLVERKVKELTESHKAFINAESPAGLGSRSDGAPGDEGKAATMQDLMAEQWQDK